MGVDPGVSGQALWNRGHKELISLCPYYLPPAHQNYQFKNKDFNLNRKAKFIFLFDLKYLKILGNIHVSIYFIQK